VDNYVPLSKAADGTITTQQLILEQDCADTYGISKPAAREVLQRLCHENYLKSYPRKGYMVREITPDECIQSQQVRYQLEAYCIRLLIKNGDPDEILDAHLRDIYSMPAKVFIPHTSKVSCKAAGFLIGSLHKYPPYVLCYWYTISRSGIP